MHILLVTEVCFFLYGWQAIQIECSNHDGNLNDNSKNDNCNCNSHKNSDSNSNSNSCNSNCNSNTNSESKVHETNFKVKIN